MNFYCLLENSFLTICFIRTATPTLLTARATPAITARLTRAARPEPRCLTPESHIRVSQEAGPARAQTRVTIRAAGWKFLKSIFFFQF